MKVVITEQQLQEGIRRLADQIRARYQGRPLTIVGVLIGSVVLLADLIRLLDIPFRVELIQATSYRHGAKRPSPLVINPDLMGSDVRGRDVLLVDDVFHTGQTLYELIPQMDDLGTASVHTAVLLRKAGCSQVPVKPDFVGFDIPDGYVVGYGLDYHDRFRQLPHVAMLEPQDMEEAEG